MTSCKNCKIRPTFKTFDIILQIVSTQFKLYTIFSATEFPFDIVIHSIYTFIDNGHSFLYRKSNIWVERSLKHEKKSCPCEDWIQWDCTF